MSEMDRTAANDDRGQPRSNGLVVRIRPRRKIDDLKLPTAQLLTLHALGEQVSGSQAISAKWFGGVHKRHLALLAGTAQEDKEHVAEALATRLGWELYRVDLSVALETWSGAVRDEVRRVIETAGEDGAVLFFVGAANVFGEGLDVDGSAGASPSIASLRSLVCEATGLVLLSTDEVDSFGAIFTRELDVVVELAER